MREAPRTILRPKRHRGSPVGHLPGQRLRVRHAHRFQVLDVNAEQPTSPTPRRSPDSA
ncbi:hypothetical protein ACR6C2_14680 [Streptomyces sp. INA 01156]